MRLCRVRDAMVELELFYRANIVTILDSENQGKFPKQENKAFQVRFLSLYCIPWRHLRFFSCCHCVTVVLARSSAECRPRTQSRSRVVTVEVGETGSDPGWCMERTWRMLLETRRYRGSKDVLWRRIRSCKVDLQEDSNNWVVTINILSRMCCFKCLSFSIPFVLAVLFVGSVLWNLGMILEDKCPLYSIQYFF